MALNVSKAAKKATKAVTQQAPQGPALDGQQWLDMALSALGGGPDRSAYVMPFDAAEQRARQAHAEAVPAIAANYDRMRSELGQSQQVVDRDANAARQNMAGTNAALQQQIQQFAAPILADLASQGNTPALGGLLGGAQAQIGTGQAQLAQQAATQQQLSGNMQAASTQAYNSRLQDSQLAQQAATASSGNTLNSVLARLDQQKAQAMQQYAQDAQSHGSAVARARMEALERQEAANDPLKQIELELRRADLEDRRMDLDERRNPGQANRYQTQLRDWQLEHSERNPVAYSTLTEFLADQPPIATAIANIRAEAKGKQNIVREGKRISVNWLIDRVKELDELERLAEEESASRPKSRR